jgi:hypothetical protein
MYLPHCITSFRFSLHRHWPWPAGVVVLLFSLAFGLSQLPAMRVHDADLRRQILSLEAKIHAPMANAARAFDLSSRLAGRDRLAIVTSDLQATAMQNGLILSDATYQPQDAYGSKDIGKMGIGVNLKGAYPALKKMLAGLLNTHDGLALESLSIRRAKSTDTGMDIEAHFSFYYRKAA